MSQTVEYQTYLAAYYAAIDAKDKAEREVNEISYKARNAYNNFYCENRVEEAFVVFHSYEKDRAIALEKLYTARKEYNRMSDEIAKYQQHWTRFELLSL
jgi:hypothetical protein